jgi:hypothetical protein
MVGTLPQSYAPQFASGIIQVTSQSMGQILVDSIRKQFPHRKTQRGDFYLDYTNQVLDTNLSLIKPDDQHTIKVMLETSVPVILAGSINPNPAKRDRVIDSRRKLEMPGDSRLEKFLKAREFKELAKELYIVTKVRSWEFPS